eukprot:GILK01010423.1.p1 GENE.GILK01010423.1~~GILK01010423.1.p1  ORF type:complete len:1716 (+),score=307.25 GILK01010423.1:79-5226(+)
MTIYTLDLNEDGSLPNKKGVLRLEKNSRLRLSLPAGGTANRSPVLVYSFRGFVHGDRHEHQGSSDAFGNWSCQLDMSVAGAFTFHIQYTAEDGTICQSPTGRVVVEPVLKIAGKPLPCTGIVLQTVLSRCLGSVSQWPRALAAHAQAGYNMVHFTPMQRLGASGSMYSIADQCTLDDALFPEIDPSLQDYEVLKFEALGKITKRLETELGMLSLVDIVLNHTAHTTPWLAEHPEAGYGLDNCPYLTVSYVLDEALMQFSRSLMKGQVNGVRCGAHINNEGDLQSVMHALKTQIIPPLKLHEYFLFNLDSTATRFLAEFSSGNGASQPLPSDSDLLSRMESLVMNLGSSRYGAEINMKEVVTLFSSLPERQAVERFRSMLTRLNEKFSRECADHLNNAVQAIEGTVRYQRLQARIGPLSEAFPLVAPYFTRVRDGVVLANNGFIWDGDSQVDFAAYGTWSYLRREIVIWSDCVKLRFGSQPSDCPWLWDHMEKYVRGMSKVFPAIRLDNAHSTPLHVAEYLLDCGRQERPDLYVLAELFTGDEDVDSLFESRLALNALIREAMQAPIPRELGRLVHRFGGRPVASFSPIKSAHQGVVQSRSDDIEQELVPSLSPAVFYDCTHDNETPAQKRSARDALPTAALVAITGCASGSVRGFDELIPSTISVVTERRLFKVIESDPTLEPIKTEPKPQVESESNEVPAAKFYWNHGGNSVEVRGSWDAWGKSLVLSKVSDRRFELSQVLPEGLYQFKFIVDGSWVHDSSQPTAKDSGGNINNQIAVSKAGNNPQLGNGSPSTVHSGNILAAKQILNRLHRELAVDGFTEIFVDQHTEDVTVVQRHQPDTHESVFVVTRSAFSHSTDSTPPRPVFIPGQISEIIAYGQLGIPHQNYKKDDRFINGLEGNLLLLKGTLGEVGAVRDASDRMGQEIHFNRLPTGSFLLLRSRLPSKSANASKELNRLLNDVNQLEQCFNNVSLVDLNHLLYRCDAEERDASGGRRGVYDIPGHGPLIFAGLQGFVTVLDAIRRTNDLGHPLCNNLREGPWMMDFVLARLEGQPSLAPLRDWMTRCFACVRSLPHYLVPTYFDAVVSKTYGTAVHKAFSLLSLVGRNLTTEITDEFVRRLCLGSIQFYGNVPSAPLLFSNPTSASLCAGLPFFSTGFMRNWGRDTFIAFRGLLLLTGRFAEARETLLAYGSVSRHGLIPNLMDGGNKPRFNARDATWFFLQGVQDYCNFSREGIRFLETPIDRVFLSDSMQEHERLQREGKKRSSTVAELIHEILQAHARGIQYREWNAGSQIDSEMKDNGFNVRIRFDASNGLILGGNLDNCGTWMDKMGSSQNAGNKGVPTTPRDGAPIEIIALLKSTLDWVTTLIKANKFPFSEVTLESGSAMPYQQWNQTLQSNFERCFWVPVDPTEDSSYDLLPKFIHRRGLYKDTFGGERPWTDYQLRPNMCIAMAVAPNMFDSDHARIALKLAEEVLMGPLGMRTLDPKDMNYRPNYDNSNDSTDAHLGKGANYHQGPEWVWPVGYFLRAKLHFELQNQSKREAAWRIMKLLLPHRQHLLSSAWTSLPELTNLNGSVCRDSCPSQAWSLGTLIDLLVDLQNQTDQTNTTTNTTSTSAKTTVVTAGGKDKTAVVSSSTSMKKNASSRAAAERVVANDVLPADMSAGTAVTKVEDEPMQERKQDAEERRDKRDVKMSEEVSGAGESEAGSVKQGKKHKQKK